MRQLRLMAMVLVMAGAAELHFDLLMKSLGQEAAPTEEKSSTAIPDASKPDVAKPDRLERRRNRLATSGANVYPFPVFSIDEVIDRLTDRGSRLYKSGKTKSDAELRKQLDRMSCELTLPAAATEPLSDRDIYRRACESVFLVCSLYKGKSDRDWQTSLATAFVVTSDGVLATSCHVFDNEDSADAVIVMDVKMNIFPVTEILAANKGTDTCLFRIDAKDLKPLPLGEDAHPGTTVRVLGHPGDSFFYFTTGVVTNYERDEEKTTWMNVTADFGQGSSGGPVMDEFGNVVGQVSRTYTLYASGSPTRSRPKRVADKPNPRRSLTQEKRDDSNTKPKAEKKDAESGGNSSEKAPDEEDYLDPQLVFKSCVPVRSLRLLVKQN